MVGKRKRIGLTLLWLLVVPAGTYYTYHYYPPVENIFSIDIFFFILLICLISFFPIIINGLPIFFIQGVSLAIFLKYGIFIEMVISQIGMLTLMLRLRVRRNEFFRIPMNSMMIFIISLVGGLFYYGLGGQHEDLNLADMNTFLLIVACQVVLFVVNQLCVNLIDFYIYEQKINLFGKDQVLDILSSIIVFPVGLLLYSTFEELGLIAIFIVGIPLISLTLVLRLYYNADKVNTDLHRASEIGHRLTGRLDIKQVLDLFINEITTMFAVDEAYIFDMDSKDNRMQLLRFHSKSGLAQPHLREISPLNNLILSVLDSKKSKLLRHSSDLVRYEKHNLPEWVESGLIVPILKGNNMEGLMLLLSRKTGAFEKSQLMIADILCSYLASAIENAKHYEKAKEKSERCSLTKLYNHYYLEDYLTRQFNSINQGEVPLLTLILIDLDHFKDVNDTYGHLSGNEVLIQVAERLRSLIQYKGIACRYGGEEFVIVLPNVGSKEGFAFAELVRQTIGKQPYTLFSDLGEDRSQVLVNVTASIGVATSPENADDPYALLRHADRAMYTGAKRAGRNKVAQYIK